MPCNRNNAANRRLTARGLRLVAAGLLAGPALALPGCADVQPWQRGHLAKPQMQLEPLPVQRTVREHTYVSREATMGGGGASGGGCGCN
ncbi:DUF4266 domain-containing protein [Methyloterricola oryzae]|uniref:DUF4266 domain-containing protein n=1 Tax=Methyloterricola oryzae TaxID=1495050 RepID=UPI001F3E358A|nr:DUF4266 domain-containing protein [Methyloterricola oryzae]